MKCVCLLAALAAQYSADAMSGKNLTEVVQGDAAGIARAARILTGGGLVAVPTETVYGLASRADSEEAVARIYAAKGRPDFNPLIVHVRDVDQARSYADFAPAALEIADANWPGPLTLVLPHLEQAKLANAVTAGLPTLALRAPRHPTMRRLLGLVDFPIAAPSANRSGFISPTTADHVLASLDGRIDLVLDAGPTEDGVESTILVVRADGTIHELRPGPISIDGSKSAGWVEPVEAPGQLASHYAPGKPVRLSAAHADPDEFMIGFGNVGGDCTLSDSGSLSEAASNLYACLHQAAKSQKSHIAVAPIPGEGIGRAINDRLRRAATPAD